MQVAHSTSPALDKLDPLYLHISRSSRSCGPRYILFLHSYCIYKGYLRLYLDLSVDNAEWSEHVLYCVAFI
jgi:hypothetical protein